MIYLGTIAFGLLVAVSAIWAGRRLTDWLFPRPKLHASYGSADAIADKVGKILEKREKKR